MKLRQLQQLLAKLENPKPEFKREWYSGTEKLDDKGWGEFLKDIIALANGNIGYVGQTAYLIVGADDEDPVPGGYRKTFHVPANGMLSQLQKLREVTLRKLQISCSPSIPDLNFEFVSVGSDKRLFVIQVPSPSNILKLDRDLNTRGMQFRKGTVLNRVGQDISVAGPVEIDTLQREFRKFWGMGNKVQNVLHNLPQPDYVHFVGRKEEFEQLHNLLDPQDRIWAIVIDGIGGIGKSALALEVAHHYLKKVEALPQDRKFDAIIWTSAKVTSLTADGFTVRQQVARTIEDIYKAISTTLNLDSISLAQPDEQTLFIFRALTQHRTLLIIDNLENIDDTRVKAFIRELPVPTKCIITSRHRIDIADPIRLIGMPRVYWFSGNWSFCWCELVTS